MHLAAIAIVEIQLSANITPKAVAACYGTACRGASGGCQKGALSCATVTSVAYRTMV